MWGLITNRIMSGMSMSGRSRSIAEVVSNINRPRGNWLGGERCIYHENLKKRHAQQCEPLSGIIFPIPMIPLGSRGSPAGNGCERAPLKTRGRGNRRNS